MGVLRVPFSKNVNGWETAGQRKGLFVQKGLEKELWIEYDPTVRLGYDFGHDACSDGFPTLSEGEA